MLSFSKFPLYFTLDYAKSYFFKLFLRFSNAQNQFQCTRQIRWLTTNKNEWKTHHKNTMKLFTLRKKTDA